MKKLSFLIGLLMSIVVFSQDLMGLSWQLQKVKYQGKIFDYFVPSQPDPSFYRNNTVFSSASLESQLFNSFNGNISSVTHDHFTVNSFGGTLMDSPDENFKLFENNYANIFLLPESPRTFHYAISPTSGNMVQLVLTDDENGNQIFYQAQMLGSNQNLQKKLSVYPNPVTDVLKIKNLRELSMITITDASGKKVYESISNGKEMIEVNLKHLPQGNYFVKVNDEQPLKIVKH